MANANESAVGLAGKRVILRGGHRSRLELYRDLIECYLEEAPNHGPPDRDPKPKDTGQPEPWNTILTTIDDVSFNVDRVGMTEDAERLRAVKEAIASELSTTRSRK